MLFIIAIVGIILGKLTKNNILAGAVSMCPDCTTGQVSSIYTSNGNGTHKLVEKCSSCPYTYTSSSIACTGTTKDVGNGNGTHSTKFTCTYCHATTTKSTTSCTGGYHGNGGKCETCGQVYQNHTEKKTWVYYPDNQHREQIKCSCGNTRNGAIFPCETETKGYKSNPDGITHNAQNVCIDCGHESLGEKTECTFSDEGECTKGCGNIKISGGGTPDASCTHTYEVKKDERNHWEECSKCNDKKTAEAHKDATHENEGKCTVCEYQYQQHTFETESEEYEKTAEGHIPIYKCTIEGCTETTKGTTLEAHTGATHENEGKCIVCEYQYQIHEKSETIKEYKKTETGHTPIYGCTYEGCNGTYLGEEESHNVEVWTDEENGVHSGDCTECGYKVTEEHDYGEDGKCTECGSRIPEEECEHTYEIQKNETHHWKYCSKCETAKEGSLETHKYGKYTDDENGKHNAKCTVCEYKLTENHNYEMKNDDTYHWEACTKCETIKEGTKEKHTYGKYIDNGNGTHSATCIKCKYKLTETHNYKEDGTCDECENRVPSDKCNHKYEMKHDDTYHWKFCPICQTIEEGTKEKHTYEKYVDNGDGTHSATCTKCKYKLTETHDYDENGKCTDCKDTDKEDDTKPEDENKENNNNTDKDNSNNNNNNNNNNSNKDDTTADKEIPKAGIQSVTMIVIIALCTVLGISIFKMKKYKDI